MTLITASTAFMAMRESLRLPDTQLDVKAPEFIAAAVRRVAADRCPCPSRTIRSSVASSIDGLSLEVASADQIDEAIDALTTYGDLIEFTPTESGESSARRLLVPAPPRFIIRKSEAAFVLGIAPGDLSPLSAELDLRLEFVGYSRQIRPRPGEDLTTVLSSLGLDAWSESDWLRTPSIGGGNELLSFVETELLKNPLPSGSDNLEVAIFDGRPSFYAARWQPLRKAMNGNFVGRSPVTYGAAAWCIVRVSDGNVTHLLKFPFLGTGGRACDEAWVVLSAMDSAVGQPQVYSIVRETESRAELQLFSPIPAWIQRRLHVLGNQNPQPKGCLLSFSFPDHEIAQEIAYLENNLWLVERADRRPR